MYTLDLAQPRASAVAIKEGTIAYVGPVDEVREYVGPRTEVVSLKGSMLLPGFQDAHCHPPSAGRDLLRIDLRQHHDLPSYRVAIAEYARHHPKEAFLAGGGWSLDVFPRGIPSKQELDDLVSDRPVFLMNRDGHGAWLNSSALAVAGITKDSPDPWDGRIERDANGEPSGTLHEGAATRFRDEFVPQLTDAEWDAAILEAQKHLHSFGVTTVQDAKVTPQTLRSYRALAERGQLRTSVVASLWWDRDRGLDQIEDLTQQRAWGTFGPIDAGTVKVMVDGIIENYTAAMAAPYLDCDGHATGGCGIQFLDREELCAVVTCLDAAGFQAHFHAIGDLAVRHSLDAVEAARVANGPLRRPTPHRTHSGDRPEGRAQIRWARRLANCQPLWACASSQVVDLTIPLLGDERSGWLYRFGDLRRAGAKLAFGSDWAVSSPNPLLEMEVAVTRVSPFARGGDALLPEQSLDLPTALRAFTLGSAYANRRDDRSGSLTAGKAADLVVLDRDLTEPGAGPIGDAQVLLTIVAGEVVFERR